MDDTICSKNLSVLFNIALLELINSFSYKNIYILFLMSVMLWYEILKGILLIEYKMLDIFINTFCLL